MDYSYSTTASSADFGAMAGLMSGVILLVLFLAFLTGVMIVVGQWKVFAKAGQPGWVALVPFYNVYVLTVEVTKKEVWWFAMMFVPFVNAIFLLLTCLEVAKKFGKSTLFGAVGLWLFPMIGWLMLGFGDARYDGNATPVVDFGSSTPPPAAPTVV